MTESTHKLTSFELWEKAYKRWGLAYDNKQLNERWLSRLCNIAYWKYKDEEKDAKP